MSPMFDSLRPQMFLFVLGLNFKAVKPMFLEPVLYDAILGNSEFTSDMDACGWFRAGGSHGGEWKLSWANSSPGGLPTWDNRTWLGRLARDKAMLTEA